jgi:DHA1 family tetracycline resistance protein-like MFS transporter
VSRSSPPPARTRATLPVLFGVVIVDLVGFGIVIPVLPFYADAYGANAATLGLLFTCYAGAQFLCAPLWGRLSDRIGRRPVMLCTIAGTAASLLFLGLAGSLAGLFAARLLAGVFAANLSVASAYVADVTEEHERTRWMGMIGASFGIGFVLGPAVGGLLAPLGYATPMLAAAALSAANLAVAFTALREPPRHAASPGASGGRLQALRDPLLRRLCASNLAFTIGVTQLEVVFAYFLRDRYGWDARHFGFLLVAMAVVMGTIQGGAMRPLAARFGERALVVGGSLLLAASFLALPFTGALPALLGVLVVAAVGRAILQPPLMSLASAAATPESRGRVMGAFQSSASLGRVVGPLAAGLYEISRVAPFHLAGGLLLVVAFLALALPARLGEEQPSPVAREDETWSSPSFPP